MTGFLAPLISFDAIDPDELNKHLVAWATRWDRSTAPASEPSGERTASAIMERSSASSRRNK